MTWISHEEILINLDLVTSIFKDGRFITFRSIHYEIPYNFHFKSIEERDAYYDKILELLDVRVFW